MVAAGAKPSHAKSLADVLVEGDCRGHYSHGLNRMDMYVKDIQTGICSKDGEPVIEKESVATALVNGENVLGPVVGNFCMDLAIKKAKDVGIGWVVAKGSNHYGIAGYYAMQALKQDMIGMSYTNTSPLVVPTRARDCTLGTNPISVAAPANDADSFVLDMATSAVALGKVELHHRSGDTIPEGWGCDSHGKPSTDPGKVLSGGGLLPIGGCEATGGYKGYGLGMMVEVFCGILAGSQYSKHIRTWKVTDRVANLVELHHRSGDTIPEGWGCDSHGKPSTDPGKVLSGGGLLPIGGCEATGGYKGYGLGMMVEVFCGILAGSQYSKHIRTWKVTDRVANLNKVAKTLGVTPELPVDRPLA
ncbi:UNVERIFIED_CONTAM: hypothetical protein FKN15_074542 [Acipenser sinensis]